MAREAADAVLGVDRVAVLVETADLVLALRADDVLLLPWGSATAIKEKVKGDESAGGRGWCEFW